MENGRGKRESYTQITYSSLIRFFIPYFIIRNLQVALTRKVTLFTSAFHSYVYFFIFSQVICKKKIAR